MLFELDSRTTTEMITDWERMLGIPDACTPLASTLQGRREAVHTKWTAKGGQSVGYFVNLALKLGWIITITEYNEFKVGQSRVGDALNNVTWPYVWTVNTALDTITYFRVGQSRVGEALADWDNTELECLINTLKPSHTRALFNYS